DLERKPVSIHRVKARGHAFRDHALTRLREEPAMSLAAAAVVATHARARALQDLTAREIAARIAARELSSAEVVEHFLARLAAVDSTVNAVTADLSESARKAAA